ncbi:hypothetical protein ElyMa_005998700 [Elysia marginata]|uniref:Uncharacterized protein n=1 Tax=Elysia marginata TaxID=1093978 RepID=A0AAV4GGF8_9GAST|nr:hypothetical protein ElyMa_005998700 [Elysia marginata]
MIKIILIIIVVIIEVIVADVLLAVVTAMTMIITMTTDLQMPFVVLIIILMIRRNKDNDGDKTIKEIVWTKSLVERWNRPESLELVHVQSSFDVTGQWEIRANKTNLFFLNTKTSAVDDAIVLTEACIALTTRHDTLSHGLHRPCKYLPKLSGAVSPRLLC